MAFIKDKILLKNINDVVKMERNAGIVKWGDFHSSMERYAVIKAEMEEAQEEVNKLFEELEKYWTLVKDNQYDLQSGALKRIDEVCRYLIAETMQIMGACLEKE